MRAERRGTDRLDYEAVPPPPGQRQGSRNQPRIPPLITWLWLGFWALAISGTVWKVARRPVTNLVPTAKREDTVKRTVYNPADAYKVPMPRNNTQGPYRHAQLLGFNIQTTPGQAEFCTVGEKCYLGKKNIDCDIRGRVQLLETAVENAFASKFWDPSPTTLKVFMAPEFFFRGPLGAYRVSPILEGSVKLGESLDALFQQKRFENWLFVPGTIVAAEPVLSPDPSRKEYLYFNVAPIYKGGSKLKWLHFKETVATIDFLEMNTTGEDVVPKPSNRTYSQLPAWMDRHLNRAGFRYAVNGKFNFAGLTIGIEICADHGGATLAGRQNGTVHLQLIVSGGMSIAKGPVVVPAGGPVFLVDGFGRTEISRNLYGMGLMFSENAEAGKDLYNVGPVHWASMYSSLRNWLALVVRDLTGSSGATPTGFSAASETLHLVHRVNALGPHWQKAIDGLFVTESYAMVTKAYEALRDEMAPLWDEHRKLKHGIGMKRQPPPPATYPTVDIYAPMPLVELTPRRLPTGELLQHAASASRP